MNKQYVNGIQKQKKAYSRLMDSRMVIAILDLLFNDWEGDNIYTVQRTEAKKIIKYELLGSLSDSTMSHLTDMPILQEKDLLSPYNLILLEQFHTKFYDGDNEPHKLTQEKEQQNFKSISRDPTNFVFL